MKKPWEETWKVDGSYVVLPAENKFVHRDVPILKGDGEDADRARLASAAPDLAQCVRLACAIQKCPFCLSEDIGDSSISTEGNTMRVTVTKHHYPDCAGIAALVKAGVLPESTDQ